MPNQSTIQSVSRIFDILEYLAQSRSGGVSEIARAVNLSKGTVHRMLTTLCELGYVSKDLGDRYFMTTKFLRLSASMLKFYDIRSQIRPFLEELSKKSGETVHFVKRDGDNIVYIDKVESNANSLQMVSRIGLTHPLYCTGVGKAILANLSDNETKDIWHSSQIIPRTPKTITDFDAFLCEIEKIRNLGFAIDDEENEMGVKCVACSICDENGKFDYAFSISAPVSRMDDKRISELSHLLLEIKEKF